MVGGDGRALVLSCVDASAGVSSHVRWHATPATMGHEAVQAKLTG